MKNRKKEMANVQHPAFAEAVLNVGAMISAMTNASAAKTPSAVSQRLEEQSLQNEEITPNKVGVAAGGDPCHQQICRMLLCLHCVIQHIRFPRRFFQMTKITSRHKTHPTIIVIL